MRKNDFYRNIQLVENKGGRRILITTAQGFDTALEFIQEEQSAFNRTVDSHMDATQVNSIFSEIESDINNLYEKVRILEDIKEYVKEFVLRAIEERRVIIEENLKVIERNVDDYQNVEFIVTKVGFDNVIHDIIDRDGTRIKPLKLQNNALTLPSTLLAKEQVLSISNLGQVKEIKQYDDLFAEAEPFEEQPVLREHGRNIMCSIYEADQPVEGGINIKYEIQFSHLTDCNVFYLLPINCEIKRLSVVDSDNVTHYLTNDTIFIYPTMQISKAIVILNCSNYENTRIDVPYNSEKDSFDSVIEGGDLNND